MCCLNYSKNEFQKNKSAIVLYDIEGIIGVISLHHTHMKRNSSLAFNELVIVIDELKKAKFTKIAICAVHDAGTNHQDIYSLINDNTIVNIPFDELYLNASKYQYALMIGFHGMFGSGGKFDHTFRHDIISCEYDRRLRLGELGVFYRFFQNNGVQVLLVSGEGSFLQEFDNAEFIRNNTFIVKQDFLSKNDLENEFCRFRMFLRDILSHMDEFNFGCSSYNGDLTISVDNPDKYNILSKREYGFHVIDNRFFFKTINDFIRDILKFCLALNYATKIILQENIKLLELIKNSNSDIGLLLKYNKPFEQISDCDRMQILIELGIKHEPI